MDWLGIQQGEYKKLQNLSKEYKNRELKRMMNEVLTDPPASNETLLFDAHLLRIHKGNISKAYSSWIGGFDGIILIKSPSEEAVERILKDIDQKRKTKQLISTKSREFYRKRKFYF
ncbi:MAG: hypothetical protein ABEI53_00660 [Candidatus Magasanikbacteria bacterium]